MSGVSNMTAAITSINKLKAAIRTMPQRMRRAVALDAAGYLDIEVRANFDAGRTVFDTPRPLGVMGNELTLVGGRTVRVRYRHEHANTTGEIKAIEVKRAALDAYRGRSHVRDSLGFSAKNEKISAVLGQRYAKYLIGKYQILPQKLPAAWAEYLTKLVQEYRDSELEGAKQ